MQFTVDFMRIFSIGLLHASPILVFFVSLVVAIGLLIGKEEGWTRTDALYHSFITATTVGYGDFHPRKKSSKVLAVVVALLGLLLTGMVVAIGLHAALHAFESVHDVKEFFGQQ